MNAPRCSVILPTHNRVKTLPRAVTSVLAQSVPDLELIIVDDASTDETPAWLATLDDPRIRIARAERNQGPSAARNTGIAMATAPVIAFLDSDDAYLPDRLAVPLAVLERESDVICTLCSARREDKAGQGRAVLLPDVKLAAPAFEWAMICDLVGVETTSITVRREHAAAIGGFCPALRRTEDREFLLRLAPLGGLRVLPDVLFEKGWSTDGLSNDWAAAGRGFVDYVRARPEFLGRHRKLGHYFATKILIMHLRHRDLPSFFADLRRFHAAGLLAGGAAQLWRDHAEVRRYRRAHSSAEALATLQGPPPDWVAH
ncbi:MAG: glycosyltransferase [Xanthobacteraceae bacterium]